MFKIFKSENTFLKLYNLQILKNIFKSKKYHPNSTIKNVKLIFLQRYKKLCIYIENNFNIFYYCINEHVPKHKTSKTLWLGN